MAKDFCSVADYDCLNPAGFGNMGGYANNIDGPRTSVVCYLCGGACCAKCRTKIKGQWYCNYCAEKVE